MPAETPANPTDPVELLEGALAYVVIAERLLRLASDAIASSDLSDARARTAYRHAINAGDRLSSALSGLTPVTSALERAIGLQPS
jgi:hypothetical protein